MYSGTQFLVSFFNLHKVFLCDSPHLIPAAREVLPIAFKKYLIHKTTLYYEFWKTSRRIFRVRLFTVPYFSVRSLMSIVESDGPPSWSLDVNHPYPRAFCTLPSFARIKRPRWRPVGFNDRHLRSNGKIGDCEQSTFEFSFSVALCPTSPLTVLEYNPNRIQFLWFPSLSARFMGEILVTCLLPNKLHCKNFFENKARKTFPWAQVIL